MTDAKRRALRAALAVTLGGAATLAGCDALPPDIVDKDPCTGLIFVYRDKDGCACQTAGDLWEDKWFEPGVCTHMRAIPGPFVPPSMG